MADWLLADWLAADWDTAAAAGNAALFSQHVRRLCEADTMTILKQSTQIVVRIGPFVDATDGVTPETGITLGAADQAEILKAAGAATVDIAAATWAAVAGADGWYDLTLTTSHTDTIGEMIVIVQDLSVALPVFQKFQVVEEAVYADLFAASADPFAEVGAIKTKTDFLPSATAGSTGGVFIAGTNAATTVTTSFTSTFTGNLTGSVASVSGAVGSVTGAVGSVAGNVDGSIGSLGATAKTDVNTEADNAIETYGLDHLISSTLPTSWAVDVAAGSVFDQVADDGTAAYDRTTDSLQAVRDHVGDGTNLTEAGGTGDQFSGLNDVSTAEVLTQVNAALDTAIAELGVAAPTATPTIRTGLMLLYMALRNKTVVQTSGTDALEIYNNAGTKIAAKLLTDDGSDYTEAEMA